MGKEVLLAAPKDFEILGLTSSDLDISNSRAVHDFFLYWKPELVINAAAYTAVDKAEQDAARAYAVNSGGVANIAMSAEYLKIPVIHISTDYVFSGVATSPYTELDAAKPMGVYGASKLAGERHLVKICRQHIVVRTSWIFGAHGNNFVKTMLRLARQYDTLSVVADQYGSPTSARSIAFALWRLAENYRSIRFLPWGIYHFSGSPVCSWHEFAKVIFGQAYQYGLIYKIPDVIKVSSAKYGAAAPRPAWSVMDCSLIYERFSISQPDWRLDLSDLFTSCLSARVLAK